MGKKPLHHRAWQAARRVVVLMTVFALIIAPLVVILTHGPAAHEVVGMAGEIAAHGHAHSEPGHDSPSGPLGGHNAADHDHQLQALICQSASAQHPFPDKVHGELAEAFRHLTPDGPERPPRSV